jgi:transposase
MTGRKYDSYLKMATVQEKAMCVLWFFETHSVIKPQRRYRTQHGEAPPSDNAIRRWVKQLQETGSVLHRKGAGRPSTSQEDVDRIQEVFTRSPQKLIRPASLQIGVLQTTVRRVVHNRLHLHAYWARKPRQ